MKKELLTFDLRTMSLFFVADDDDYRLQDSLMTQTFGDGMNLKITCDIPGKIHLAMPTSRSAPLSLAPRFRIAGLQGRANAWLIIGWARNAYSVMENRGELGGFTKPFEHQPAGDTENLKLLKPKKKKWPWRTALLVLGALIFVLRFVNFSDDLGLEVTRRGFFSARDGRIIEIINVGTKPIRLINIVANERADCLPRTDEQLRDNLFSPKTENKSFVGRTLNVGDKTSYNSYCLIIRAKIETDRGTSVYSF